MKISPQRFK